MSENAQHDAVVLVQRPHADWRIDDCRSPLFVCSEMFLELRDIEARRWRMWALREELGAAGLPVATLCEFLQPTDIEWLESQGTRIGHGWYIDGSGADTTLYRGVSLGRCIEYDAKARVIRLLKLSRCIERLRERHPEARFLTDAEETSVEYRMLQGLRIPVQRVGAPQTAVLTTSAPPAAAPTLRQTAMVHGRRLGLEAIRWLSRLSSRRQPASTPRVVVRVSMQSSAMLQSWLEKPRPGIRFSLWMDYLMRPRVVLSLVLAGHSLVARRPAPPPEGGTRESRPLQEGDPGRIAPTAHLQPLLAEMLGELSTASFPSARKAIDDAYAELGRPATSLLVIPNDCQLIMRAWTLVATLLGQQTLVLQHGHLDYTEDGDHMTASRSAFWSAMVAQHFARAGLRPEQILVTGSPNADHHVRRQRALSPRGRRRPRILIITTGNPAVQAYVGESWVCDYIVGILDALSPRLDDFEIAVKLHPGENAELYRQHLGTRLPAGTAIGDRGDLAGMIAKADVLISPPSTVVIEARAGGAPVILTPIPTVEGRTTTLSEAEGVVTVERYEELPATIDALLSDPSQLRAGTWPLDRFFGPLDGQASARILDAVLALAQTGARTTARIDGHAEANALH